MLPGAAWSVSKFGRAAEILRHTSTKWKSDDVVLFEELLRDVSLPLLFDGAPSYVGKMNGVENEPMHSPFSLARVPLLLQLVTGTCR